MITEAIILAGGLGTRLQGVVQDLPKSMAPIRNKPFLEYQLAWLRQNGIRRVLLSVGYRHETIMNYFGNSFQGVEIGYVIESEPMGTGGGMLLAAQSCHEARAFVLNGDTMFDCDLRKMEQIIESEKADMVIALRKVDDASRYGTVVMGVQNRILGFAEKSSAITTGIINGGIYLLPIQKFISEATSNIFSFERDFLEKKCDLWNIKGMISEGFFLDIGIPADYSIAQNEFRRFDNII